MFSPKIMASANPYQWSLIFGYDEDTRDGYALTFQYFPVKGYLTVCLERVKGFRTEPLASVCLPDIMLAGDAYLEASAVFADNSLSGHFAGHEFALSYLFPTRPQGSLALARSAFVGEIIFRSVSVQSDAEPDITEIMPPRVMEIPSYNGGQLPYRLSLSVGQYRNGKTFINGRLEGGLSDRPRLKPLNGQYLAAMDRFTKPYVRLAGKEAGAKVYFHPHTLNVLDINVHWDFLKDYFDCADLPIRFTAEVDALPRIR